MPRTATISWSGRRGRSHAICHTPGAAVRSLRRLGGFTFRHTGSAAVAVVLLVVLCHMRTDSAAIGAVSGSSTDVPACHLRLPPTAGGSPRFAVPAGGKAVARALAGTLTLCRLLWADGSRFAEAEVDQFSELLDVRFYRRSGGLLFVADAAYPAKTATKSAKVGCGNAASASIGPRYWRRRTKWWLGKPPKGIPRAKTAHA